MWAAVLTQNFYFHISGCTSSLTAGHLVVTFESIYRHMVVFHAKYRRPHVLATWKPSLHEISPSDSKELRNHSPLVGWATATLLRENSIAVKVLSSLKRFRSLAPNLEPLIPNVMSWECKRRAVLTVPCDNVVELKNGHFQIRDSGTFPIQLLNFSQMHLSFIIHLSFLMRFLC